MSRCMQITFYLSNNIFDLIYLSVCSFVHVFVYLSNIFMYFSIRSSIYPFIYLSPYLFNSVYVLTCLFIYLYEIIHTYVTGFVLLPSLRKWQAPSHAVEMPNKKSLMSRHLLQSSDIFSLCFCPPKNEKSKRLWEIPRKSWKCVMWGAATVFLPIQFEVEENGAAMALCKPSKPCSKRWTPAMFLRNCSITSNGKHHAPKKNKTFNTLTFWWIKPTFFQASLVVRGWGCQCLLPLKSNPNPSKKPQKVTCFTIKPKHQNASPTRAQGQNARVVA